MPLRGPGSPSVHHLGAQVPSTPLCGSPGLLGRPPAARLTPPHVHTDATLTPTPNSHPRHGHRFGPVVPPFQVHPHLAATDQPVTRCTRHHPADRTLSRSLDSGPTLRLQASSQTAAREQPQQRRRQRLGASGPQGLRASVPVRTHVVPRPTHRAPSPSASSILSGTPYPCRPTSPTPPVTRSSPFQNRLYPIDHLFRTTCTHIIPIHPHCHRLR